MSGSEIEGSSETVPAIQTGDPDRCIVIDRPSGRLLVPAGEDVDCCCGGIRAAEPYPPGGRAGGLTVAGLPGSHALGVIMHASISRSRRSRAIQSVNGVGLLPHFPGSGSERNRPREPTG